nr:hypothetical protein GCM10020063_020050 [Dactylosporangium thailandense]
MVSVVRPVSLRLAAQCRALFGPAIEAVQGRRYGRLWLGPAAALMVAVLGFAARTETGHALITRYAVTHPDEPVPGVVVRLPLSMFAPAALLPFWFAVLQVLIVFSLAQAVLGTWRTVAVAIAGHSLATLSAPLWLAAGPPVGLGFQDAWLADAGPSAGVVALLAYAAVRCRVGWLAAALVTYHGTEVVTVGGLPSREHLVGTLTGVTLALVAAAPVAFRPLTGRRPARVPAPAAGPGPNQHQRTRRR